MKELLKRQKFILFSIGFLLFMTVCYAGRAAAAGEIQGKEPGIKAEALESLSPADSIVFSDETVRVELSTDSVVYNGQKQKPSVMVTRKDLEEEQTLTEGTDYSVVYSANKKIGTGKITITGKGDYTGTVEKTFKIVPAQVTKLAIASQTANSVKLTWKSVKGAEKYQVYQYDTGKKAWKKISTVKSAGLTVKKLATAAAVYKFKVRAYTKSASGTGELKTYYGDYSAAESTVLMPGKASLTKAVWADNKRVQITWKPLSKVSGYQLIYSTDKSFKKKAKTILISGKTKKTKSITGLNQTKTYYFKVRAYTNANSKTAGSKKIYGNYSSVKAVKPYSNVYAQYTSKYAVSEKNRNTNLRLASAAVNGTILNPGAKFSFNKVVGRRTVSKGYRYAEMLFGGRTGSGLGGGICQVSSTLYNAVLLGNLKIVEREQHSGKVDYVPAGRDSAIVYGKKDLVFSNNTKYKMKVEAKMSNGVLTVRLLTTPAVKPGKVSLRVVKKGKNYTLKRTVSGKINYTAKSRY